MDKIKDTEWTKSGGQDLFGRSDRTKSRIQIGQNQWDKKCKNQWGRF